MTHLIKPRGRGYSFRMVIHELGGWEGSKDASSVYDHGLTPAQLEEVQRVVWQAFSDAGYLANF